MSKYRNDTLFDDKDRFTIEDSHIIKELRKSDKLTDREKLALQRLYRTYDYMTS